MVGKREKPKLPRILPGNWQAEAILNSSIPMCGSPRCGRYPMFLYLEEPVRVHFLALFLCVCAGAVAAEQNRPPRLIAMGCNFDGGLTWLALGKARAGSELDSFRVEIPDVDLERVDATISPSNMDMFMPYGQGPVVGPINVSRISIGPRTVDGVANGNVVTVHFNILSSYSTPTDFLQPHAISYILVLNNKSTGCRR
jgi:hypothetical protein